MVENKKEVSQIWGSNKGIERELKMYWSTIW